MQKDQAPVPRVPRRSFLKSAALAVAPMILPTGAFGRGAQPGANGRIVTGHIGLGPRGYTLLEQLRDQAAAVSDVEENRLNHGASLTRPGTKTYTDYRELLARPDIDAVVIASPDHWHAVHAIHACEAGKDVYLETPVCRSPLAGRKILRASARFGTMIQTGTMGRSTPAFAALLAGLKDLGAVTEVTCWGTPNPATGDEFPAPAPEGLHWNNWIGPAPWRPYAAGFMEEGWRWRLDFGGGQIMRQGAQLFECVLAALDRAMDADVKVTTTGKVPAGGLYDCPQPFEAVFELEKPALKITWSQQAPEGSTGPGFALQGVNGTLAARGLGLDMAVEPPLLEKLAEAERTRTPEPLQDWLQAIEKRAQPHGALTHGILAATLAALANLSYRLKRPIAWNGSSGTCVNDDVANRMLAEPGSGPWRI